MRHPADADKLFEVFGDKLRAVVRNDPRCGLRKFFPCPLKDDATAKSIAYTAVRSGGNAPTCRRHVLFCVLCHL